MAHGSPPAPPFTTVRVSPEVAGLGIAYVFIQASGLCNGPADDAFEQVLAERTAALLQSLAPDAIDNDPVLRGYRRLHERVGATGRKNLASPEALLRGLIGRRRLPRVNRLVDLYNLVSVETRLSMGAHDLAHVAGDVVLRLTDGSERFHPLGSAGPEPVRPGEYAYVDAANDVLCRLDVRQAEKTRVTADMTDCLLIVQGNDATDDALLRRATDRLLELSARHCGGSYQVLTAPWQ